MKHKIWLFQIPLIILFSYSYLVFQWGVEGDLKSPFLRDHVFPLLRTYSGKFTDFKFKMRGKTKAKNKVVIVGIDSDSIDQIGRWPWRRDYMAILIQKIIDAGAKVVGLDMVFSEKEVRIPEDIKTILKENGLTDLINAHETDNVLAQVIRENTNKVVLGWTSDTICIPLYDEECQKFQSKPEIIKSIPSSMPAFSFSKMDIPKDHEKSKSNFLTVLTPIPNIEALNNFASHSGLFNITPDPDGTVRRTNLSFFMNGMFYPSLALEMARAGKQEDLGIVVNKDEKIESIKFTKSNEIIKTNPRGIMQVNFRGGSHTFPYISALDIFSDSPDVTILGSLKKVNKKEFFKDAYVLIGATAIGIFDLRSFPYEEDVPGVEGHANILDNLLSGDYLIPGTSKFNLVWVLALMSLGALILSILYAWLSAGKSFFIFIIVMALIGHLDMIIYFENNINFNSAFLFAELNGVYLFSALIRYILEEKNKNFLKSAFGTYIAPELIDQMYKTGQKPKLGGHVEELTAFFTDIQSFTTFSEKLSAEKLVELLNEYLTVMTDILIENKGTLDKYEGDAILAFFGAPLYFEDHPLKAARVAVSMQHALKELRIKWRSEGDKWPDFVKNMQMRIGMNTGPIVTGNMGSKKRLNYTMMGDAVNLAARLESGAKQYGVYIHISKKMRDLLNEDFIVRELDTVLFVGKNEPITTFELMDFKETLDPEVEKLLKIYNEGLALYKNKKWDEAIAKFLEGEKLENIRFKDIDNPPKNNPCKNLRERCQEFKENPPPQDWDGVYVLTEK